MGLGAAARFVGVNIFRWQYPAPSTFDIYKVQREALRLVLAQKLYRYLDRDGGRVYCSAKAPNWEGLLEYLDHIYRRDGYASLRAFEVCLSCYDPLMLGVQTGPPSCLLVISGVFQYLDDGLAWVAGKSLVSLDVLRRRRHHRTAGLGPATLRGVHSIRPAAIATTGRYSQRQHSRKQYSYSHLPPPLMGGQHSMEAA